MYVAFLKGRVSTMIDSLEYKGYTASIHYDAEDEIFFGRVDGMRGTISFHSETAHGLKEEFAKSIDFYLECCEQDGSAPEKPGEPLALRFAPSVISAARDAAAKAGQSLNDWLQALAARETGVAL